MNGYGSATDGATGPTNTPWAIASKYTKSKGEQMWSSKAQAIALF